MTSLLTADELKACPLETQIVYLDRFAKSVLIRELTGDLQHIASKYGVETIPSDKGPQRVPSAAKTLCLKIALSLWNPDTGQFLLGADPLAVVAAVGVVEGLGWRDQLLMSEVLDRVTNGQLTEDQRAFLAEPHSVIEQLDCLSLANATATMLAEAKPEDADRLLQVALRVPQVLAGNVPMSMVNSLYDQLVADRAARAAEIVSQLRELYLEYAKG